MPSDETIAKAVVASDLKHQSKERLRAVGGKAAGLGRAFLANVSRAAQRGVDKAIEATRPPSTSPELRVKQVAAGMMMMVLIPVEFVVLPIIYTILTDFTGQLSSGTLETLAGGLVPLIMLCAIVGTAYLDYWFVRKGGPYILDGVKF